MNAPSLKDETHVTRWGGFSLTLGSFFSHRTHRLNRALLRTVSNPQKASGIQISQSVKAIVDTNKVVNNHYNQSS